MGEVGEEVGKRVVGVAFVGENEGQNREGEKEGEGCKQLETKAAFDSHSIESEHEVWRKAARRRRSTAVLKSQTKAP